MGVGKNLLFFGLVVNNTWHRKRPISFTGEIYHRQIEIPNRRKGKRALSNVRVSHLPADCLIVFFFQKSHLPEAGTTPLDFSIGPMDFIRTSLHNLEN